MFYTYGMIESDPSAKYVSTKQAFPTSLTNELEAIASDNAASIPEASPNEPPTPDELVEGLALEPSPEQQQALATLTGSAKKALLGDDYKTMSTIQNALSNRPGALEALVAYGHSDAPSSWDSLVIGITAAASADTLQTKHAPRFQGFDDEEPEETPEQTAQQAADRTEADRIKALAADLGTADHSTLAFVKTYGRLEDEGISVAEAEQFHRFSPTMSQAEATAAEIKFVTERIPEASETTKRLLNIGQYDPARLLAVDRYIAEITSELEPGSPEAEAQAREVTDLLGCDSYKDPVVASDARSTFEGLLQDGATIQGLLNLFPHYDYFNDFVSAEPSEQRNKAIHQVAKLAKHPQLKFDYDPGRVAKTILSNPDDYAPVVDAIDAGAEFALETGYPQALASHLVEKSFEVYMSNLMNIYGKDGEGLPQVRANYVKSNFEAMHQLGPSSVHLQKLVDGRTPTRDNFSTNLAVELLNGSASNVDQLRSKIVGTSDSLSTMSSEQPEVYRALIERTRIAATGDIDSISAYVGMAAEVGRRSLLTGMIPAENYDNGIQRVIHGVSSRMDYANNVFSEGLFSSLDELETVLKSDSRFDRSLVANQFIGKTDGEHSAAFRNLLLSPKVQELMSDETMRAQVNDALSTLDYEMGKYDLDKAVSTFQAIAAPMPGWLGEIMAQEARFGGANKALAIRKFYEVAPKVLSRLDKDGNHYDSPKMLASAIAPLTRHDGAEQAANINWFFDGDLPAAAAEPVNRFRADAQKAGIEDSPSAVYEWLYRDPDKIAELSRDHLQEYLTGRLRMADGRSHLYEKVEQVVATELLDRLGEEVDRSADDFRIFVNMSPDTAIAVMQAGGSLKSMYDAGIDRDMGHLSYVTRRSGVEVALGVRSMDDNTPHAIYGSCGYVGDGIPSGAAPYGLVMASFPFSEDLKDKVSFTPEDSFHGAYRLTARDAQIMRMFKSGRGQGHTSSTDYVETQITGGINMAASEHLYVPDDAMAEKLRAGLPEDMRDRVVVRSGAGTYQATRERAVTEAHGVKYENYSDGF